MLFNRYLAIASAIGAAGIRFAKAQAAPIAWWYQMLHGSSAYNMEYHWQASQGLLGALRRLLHAPLVSFATFLGVVMIIVSGTAFAESTTRTLHISTTSQDCCSQVMVRPALIRVTRAGRRPAATSLECLARDADSRCDFTFSPCS